VAVEAAKQSLDLALERYKGGLVTYLEVISAQSIDLQNQSTEVISCGGAWTPACC